MNIHKQKQADRFSLQRQRAGKRPYLITGPCSAETEAQVLLTARLLAQQYPPDLFRAGIWKPRTRPDSFEGVGEAGLKWLNQVQQETGLKVITEVATAQHVEAVLEHGIDAIWIGARTTVNPFSVQEIAEALKGVEIPVWVKNPINPDLKLWIGAVERIQKAGIRDMGAIHRGFSTYGESKFRNTPRWQIPLEFKRHFPGMPLLCDNSHICGRRDLLQEVAQKALDLNYDGLMTEVHPSPEDAWSDAAQQVTPGQFCLLMSRLFFRKEGNGHVQDDLNDLRDRIDEIDDTIVELLGRRMAMAEDIGRYKRKNGIAILQRKRWEAIFRRALQNGHKRNLSPDFIAGVFDNIHEESIEHQTSVMYEEE